MTTTEPKDPTGRITQAELARRLKVSRPSVSKAVKAGRITPDEDGLFDPAEAELQWLENSRPKAQGVATKGKGGNSGYAQARARKEIALARMAELRLAQAEGDLFPREAVTFILDNFVVITRRTLEDFPARHCSSLVFIETPEAMLQALDEAVRATQQTISDTLLRTMEELRALSGD